MAITDPYISVDDFKLRIDRQTTVQDAALLQVLKAASRRIDGFCGRTFAQTDAAEPRVFTADRHSTYQYHGIVGIHVDEFAELTALKLDDGSLTYPNAVDSGDFQLVRATIPDVTITTYDRILGRNVAWPLLVDGIQITAKWGWGAVPDDVAEACFIIANRLRTIWTAPFGQVGNAELGQLPNANSITPVIREMLNPYRVMTV